MAVRNLMIRIVTSTVLFSMVTLAGCNNNEINSPDANSPPNTPTDTVAPSTPSGLAAVTMSSAQINLAWTAATDNIGVAGYRIYRDGSLIGTTTATSYSNTGLAASNTYNYLVAAYDAAGNVSAYSNQATATTSAPPPAGSGNQYWVDTTAAFKEALRVAMGGDTIIVRPGTYSDIDSTWENGFNPARSGMENYPITIQSEQRLGAVLVPPNDNVVALGIFGREYIVIDGFKVEGMLKMQNSRYITFKNCEVTRGGIENGDVSLHWGIVVHSSSDSIVANNRVYDMQPRLGNGLHNSAAIMVGFGSHRNIIENNEANAGNGVVFSAFGQKGGNLTGNVWRRNIARNARAGFLGMGSTNCDRFSTDHSYYQNIVVNSEEAFRLDHNSQRWNVYNNTAYNVSVFLHDLRRSSGCNPANIDIRVWNNQISQADIAFLADGSDVTPAYFATLLAESDHNGFHNVAQIAQWNWGASNLNTLSDWRTATGFDISSVNMDPLFIDATQENFHLQSTSPIRERGRDGLDIGAYPTGSEIIGPN